MTTETIAESAPAGAVDLQQQAAAMTATSATDGGATVTTGTTVAPTFTAEQQAQVDKVVRDRLARERKKWQEELDAKAEADAEAAEAAQQQQRGEWEALARRHESAATEAKATVKTLTERLERADAVITELVEGRKAGLPEAMVKALEGRDIYDQLQLANAFQASLAQATQPAQPNGAPGEGRRPTLPTAAPQGKRELTPDERRQMARSSW